MSIIQECLEMMNNGLEYSEVRKRLASEDYSKEEISEIMREVDDLFLNQKEPSLFNPIVKGWLKIGIGILLFLTCAGITIYSFFAPNWDYYLILSGPIIGGIVLYYSGTKDLKLADSSVDNLDKKFFETRWKKTVNFRASINTNCKFYVHKISSSLSK